MPIVSQNRTGKEQNNTAHSIVFLKMEWVASQKSIEIESLSFSQYAQRGTGSGATKLLQHWSYGTGDVKARCSGTVATSVL
jgi:hypothetical protein